MICKTPHGTIKINQHEPTKNRWWPQVLRKGREFVLK